MALLKKYGKPLAIVWCFLFFFYLTFPLNLLKPMIYNQVTRATGLTLQIGDLSTLFPFGVQADDVLVTNPALNQKILLSGVGVELSLWRLLLGTINIHGDITDETDGNLDLTVGLGIAGLSGNNPLPDSVALSAKTFDIGPIADFFIVQSSATPGANPFVSSLIEKLSVDGKLDGTADFAIEKDNLGQSEGELAINLVDAALRFKDDTMGVKDQVFKHALIKANLIEGTINVSQDTGLTSEELDLKFNGNITLAPKLPASQLELYLELLLFKDLYKNFGHMVTADEKNQKGVVNIDISGTLQQPNVTKKDL